VTHGVHYHPQRLAKTIREMGCMLHPSQARFNTITIVAPQLVPSPVASVCAIEHEACGQTPTTSNRHTLIRTPMALWCQEPHLALCQEPNADLVPRTQCGSGANIPSDPMQSWHRPAVLEPGDSLFHHAGMLCGGLLIQPVFTHMAQLKSVRFFTKECQVCTEECQVMTEECHVFTDEWQVVTQTQCSSVMSISC
jgi:hypothetical protein